MFKNASDSKELIQAFNMFKPAYLAVLEQYIGEFDPGSGRTLAARLTHASRAELRFRF